MRELEAIAVVVPTRSRPGRLVHCLKALEAARERTPFTAYVCDSSPDPADRRAVEQMTAQYAWARFHAHTGPNVAAARNECARVAEGDLLVNVDDDLVVEPDAIERLVTHWRGEEGRRIVAGSVSWGDVWTRPMTMRRIGYSRPPAHGEAPDFVIGAFFLYPRAYALAWPWPERVRAADDIFMGALWRAKGVGLLFEPDARAVHLGVPLAHDSERVEATIANQRAEIYALLFDSVLANPSRSRTFAYETLGFLARGRLYFRRPTWAFRFLRAWISGHRALLADRRVLRELLTREPRPSDAAR